MKGRRETKARMMARIDKEREHCEELLNALIARMNVARWETKVKSMVIPPAKMLRDHGTAPLE